MAVSLIAGDRNWQAPDSCSPRFLPGLLAARCTELHHERLTLPLGPLVAWAADSRRRREGSIMVIRAVVFDIGGVLEITPDLGVDRHWKRHQYRRRLPAPRPGRHPDPGNPRTRPRHEQNGHDATTPGPWRLPYSSACLHRLALEDGEVTGRGLRSLRRPARPPGSRRYRAAAHRCGRRSTAAGGLHVRDGPRPLARTG